MQLKNQKSPSSSSIDRPPFSMASLPGINLFSSLPTTPPPNDPSSSSATSRPPPKPPIPIPKYPPTRKSQKKLQSNPAFNTFHRGSKYYRPVKEGVINSDGDRAVVVGDSGVSYHLPGAPFEFQFSYSETPKVKPLGIREPAFLPFAPPTMPRPWTGKAPLKKRDHKNIKLVDSFRQPAETDKGGGGKKMEMLKPYKLGNFAVQPREKVLGKPLRRDEIRELIRPHLSSNRQVNLGRDGLTHNMLELIHTHWRRGPVCKVRCLGVPTVDMNNVTRCLEEKTGGRVIHRVGGVTYLFRGRHYDPKTRPRYPVMLWKPATPVYPKLIQEAPEGLTKTEADELRRKGKDLRPICKLAKNGVYVTLVKEVKHAFEGSILVKIDCKGLPASDYKKIGAKLKELVPCVLLSFDEEQILMWRGHGWKSMYPGPPLGSNPFSDKVENDVSCSENTKVDSHEPDTKMVRSSPKMLRLWKQAIESSRALLLDNIALGPDALLKVVDEFEITSQAIEHTYPAVIVSSEDEQASSSGEPEDEDSGEYDAYGNDSDDEHYIDDSSAPLGSLPIDSLANEHNNWDNEQWKSNRNRR